MRTLLLASDGSFLFEKGYSLLGIPLADLRIGYVITASKAARDKSYIETHKNKMKEMGLNFEEIDIEGKSENELRAFLTQKNVVHMEGGNTFYLLKAVRETGFDRILTEQIEKGLIYIGTSAGAYIATPTIEGATWKSTKDRFGITDFHALNLVPFILKAHYEDDMKVNLQENLKHSKYSLRILRDGQGILVKGEKYTFVGDGEEVIL